MKLTPEMTKEVTAVLDEYRIPYDTSDSLGNRLLTCIRNYDQVFDLIVWAKTIMPSMVEEKDFYHSLIRAYGYRAIEYNLFDVTLFSAAYAYCCTDPDSKEVWLPQAKDIFEVHRSIIRGLMKAGVKFSEEIITYVEGGEHNG